jgi:hypothetical protein
VHLTSSPVDWYAARAAGIVAYVLLTAVVALGLALAGRARSTRWPRFAVEDVHRFGGLLVGAFITVHVVTIAIDSWLPFTLTQLLVPLTAAYRPIWTGFGIAATELLIAVAITNHYRRRLPYRFWRRAHYANLAVWAGATVHGIGSGTDRSAPWMIALMSAAVALVAACGVWRIGHARLPARALGAAVAGAALLVGAAVPAAALGPMRAHTRTWNADSFDAQLTGQILVQQGAGTGIVSMSGLGTGGQRAFVRADLLLGSSGGQSALQATSLQIEYLPSGLRCHGRITQVRGTGFDGSCTMPDGAMRSVSADWTLDAGDSLHGTLQVRPA